MVCPRDDNPMKGHLYSNAMISIWCKWNDRETLKSGIERGTSDLNSGQPPTNPQTNSLPRVGEAKFYKELPTQSGNLIYTL